MNQHNNFFNYFEMAGNKLFQAKRWLCVLLFCSATVNLEPSLAQNALIPSVSTNKPTVTTNPQPDGAQNAPDPNILTNAAVGIDPQPDGTQNTPGPVISTDRPTVTPSPVVVPQNYIQAENGLALRKENSGGSFNVSQTLIRLGVLPKTELRLTVPNYFLTRTNTESISGVADIAVGLKQQIGPFFKRINLAVIPGFTIPTGSPSLTTHAVDPFIQFTASYKLSKHLTFGMAQSLFQQTEEAEPQNQGITLRKRRLIYQPTAVLFRKINFKTDLFLEYAGNFTKTKLSDQIIDAGCIYRIERNQQLDVRIGAGLTKASPIAFIEFGYSLLLGRILR